MGCSVTEAIFHLADELKYLEHRAITAYELTANTSALEVLRSGQQETPLTPMGVM
jgi:hypothetical protein